MTKTSTKLSGLTNCGDYLDVDTNGAKFRVYLIDENIIRIRSTFDEDFAPELNYALVKTAWSDATDELMADERQRVTPIAIDVKDEDDGAKSVSTGKYKLIIEPDPFAFRVVDEDGNEVHADLPGRSFVRDKFGHTYHYSKMGDNDHFYGFGEKSGELNKIRRRMRMHNTDSLGWDASKSDPLYKMIPFYIDFDSKRNLASGLFYNCSADSTFDMDSEHSNYWLRYSYFKAEEGDVDVFFIGGPTVKDVIEHYTDLTGKTAMMPLASLGYMGSTMFYSELDEDCDKAIEDFVDTCKREGVPCDGFFLSSGYTSKPDGKRCVFNWNHKRFPDPQAFVTDLKGKGALLAPNVKPGMLFENDCTEEFDDANAFVRTSDDSASQVDRYWGGPAHFPDFTNPKGRELWAKNMTRALLDLGIDSIWNDNNEYEINDNDAIVDAEGQKRTIGEMKPLMSTLMAKTAHMAFAKKDPKVRPYVINRAGFAGIQRYAQTWAGDNGTNWTNLKYNVPTILGMGLSGVANQGCDIGGFDGPAPEPELLVRWVQNGIFQPRFSIHSCNTDNTVTEPWSYPAYTKYIAAAIQLRYSLVPYFYSLLHEAATTGAPIMRALVYEFQDDPKAWDESFEFMLGPSLLVANVLDKGATSLDVYLPAGTRWYDLKRNVWIDGGTTITIPVDMGSIPMFLRDGSVIPRCPGLMNLHNDVIDHLDLLIEPDADATFTLYEDDGVSRDYESGKYLETKISIAKTRKGVTVDFKRSGDYETQVKNMKLSVLCSTVAPLDVTIDGETLPRFLDSEKFKQAGAGWFYNGQDHQAIVKYRNPSQKDYRVELGFGVKDLISI
ncbi:TIM-barrel domain-containing protein [Bifidobacterium sp. ESL0790]|uniref:glycoside hydrolase family 31 protein n=1 Tax=Bifidobacterium sp. ESL0790 TaxID=2983233 RepID=UPI0023F9F4C5|nr:TIM-barrel domain-containing protein [Bifidobacterium sp. ESL0790]WEV72621.1 DUF5110 domain-containing protein [Bifidobacterium sp. ESL0790]